MQLPALLRELIRVDNPTIDWINALSIGAVLSSIGIILFLYKHRGELFYSQDKHEQLVQYYHTREIVEQEGNTLYQLPHKISEHALGFIEGNITALRQVIVVANQIEEPTNTLQRAVKKRNFDNGVHYLFLVSPSKYESEKSLFYKIFEAWAKSKATHRKLSDIIDIRRLPNEWDDVPYIFYRTGAGEDTSDWTTFGYRGGDFTELHVGIDKLYVLLDRIVARTLVLSILKVSNIETGAGENDFVVIADLTAPEEVVLIDLTDFEKTQEIKDSGVLR